jgi:hypothetical protein
MARPFFQSEYNASMMIYPPFGCFIHRAGRLVEKRGFVWAFFAMERKGQLASTDGNWRQLRACRAGLSAYIVGQSVAFVHSSFASIL